MGGFGLYLEGRTVLVTGASSGIGRHLAKVLARNGARVVATARRESLLATLRDEIESEGHACAVCTMDVADEASTIAAFDVAEREFGPVDSVVANAGTNVAGSALGMAIEDFDRIVSVNLRGVFLTAREAAKRMIAAGSTEREHGRIVVISSVTAQHSFAKVAPYGATKAAVAQMSRLLALDWATKGINVNAVCPGYIATDMTDGLFEVEHGKALFAAMPRGRLLSVDALDPIVLYLCSDISSQVTGSVFTIDDGQTL
jgi:NAD(P)-dependent dehydrogenase (short-subunit alcohol dehydrogenase family)